MRVKGSCAWGLIAVALPARAWAQDAGGVPAPAAVVSAALGGVAPVLERSVRYRGAVPVETPVPLPTARGRCYELVGFAAGASRVTARVQVRGAAAAPEIALANSSGRAARVGFCASLPGNVYGVRVHAEGAAHWAIAVIPAPGPGVASAQDAGAAGDAAAPVDATADAPGAEPRVVYPVGGTEEDFVGRRIRAFAAEHAGATGLVPALRVVLGTNESREVALAIPSRRCVQAVAVGVPSVLDLVLELDDPTGHRVAQDATHRGDESVRYCAPYGGTYRFRVRVFSGSGLVGIQALLER